MLQVFSVSLKFYILSLVGVVLLSLFLLLIVMRKKSIHYSEIRVFDPRHFPVCFCKLFDGRIDTGGIKGLREGLEDREAFVIDCSPDIETDNEVLKDVDFDRVKLVILDGNPAKHLVRDPKPSWFSRFLWGIPYAVFGTVDLFVNGEELVILVRPAEYVDTSNRVVVPGFSLYEQLAARELENDRLREENMRLKNLLEIRDRYIWRLEQLIKDKEIEWTERDIQRLEILRMQEERLRKYEEERAKGLVERIIEAIKGPEVRPVEEARETISKAEEITREVKKEVEQE